MSGGEARRQKISGSTREEAAKHAEILRAAFWVAVKSVDKISTFACVGALRSLLYGLQNAPGYEEAKWEADACELKLRKLALTHGGSVAPKARKQSPKKKNSVREA